MTNDHRKLQLNLEFIAKTFHLAAEEPFILEIIRNMPEKDIRFVMAAVADADLGAYLRWFEDQNEFEWCRVIRQVMDERL